MVARGRLRVVARRDLHYGIVCKPSQKIPLKDFLERMSAQEVVRQYTFEARYVRAPDIIPCLSYHAILERQGGKYRFNQSLAERRWYVLIHLENLVGRIPFVSAK